MKRLLAALTAAIMIIGVVPMTELASFAAVSGEYYYSVLSQEDKICAITAYDGYDNELNIPSELDGYIVTEISREAFCRFNFVSAKIPDTVTKIGRYAFYYCENMERLTLGSSVKSICDRAFSNCSSLTSVTIPSNVESIEYEAFYNCAMSSVTIPDEVTTIEDYAFGYVSGNDESETHKKKSDFTIYGYSGSEAQRYAEKNEFKFVALDCKHTTTYDTTTKAATCSEAGLKNVVCDDCGKVVEENIVIPATGEHAYGEWIVTTEATATKNGVETRTCTACGSKETKAIDAAGYVSMYRLYNPNSGEHFYTANAGEKDNLVSLGWTYEGIGWNAPKSSSTPVYRLYNQNGGEHHYTTNAAEKDNLVKLGWSYEGIGWYSDDKKSVPLYRQYNPNAYANNHNYTADLNENQYLISLGWQAESISWYGVA